MRNSLPSSTLASGILVLILNWIIYVSQKNLQLVETPRSFLWKVLFFFCKKKTKIIRLFGLGVFFEEAAFGPS